MPAGELSIERPAKQWAAGPMRRALDAFLEAVGVPLDDRRSMILAAGEALANAVEHAYPSDEPGTVSLRAQFASDGRVVVAVADRGRFVYRDPVPGRGFGLRIMGGMAHEVHIDTTAGTTVRLTFNLAEGT